MPTTHPSDAEVRALAQEILAQADFARWRAWKGELPDAFTRWLAKLFGFLDGLQVSSPILFYLLLLALVLVACALLAHLVLSLRAALAASEPPPATVATSGPDLVTEAHRLARAERFLEASHRLQLSCLELLVERRWIELHRHEANTTLRRRLRASALPEPERRGLLGLLDRLETAWFRDRLGDAALYRDWLTLHARVAALPPASGAPA